MPKRVLFIISNMETGGVSKAMTSLLAVLDRTRVTPELLIVSPHGALMPLISKDVRIYSDRRMAALTAGVGGIWSLVRLGRPDLALMSAVRMALMRVSRCAGARLLARLMPRLKRSLGCCRRFQRPAPALLYGSQNRCRPTCNFLP